MTTHVQSTPDTKPDNKNKDNRKHHHRKEQRQPVQDRRSLVRSAAELVNAPPQGYTITVHELDPNSANARKRPRLLVLQSENGWKFLPFMSVRLERTARTDGANITVHDDLDILPNNIVESAIEVNLLTDDALLTLGGLVSEFRERQKSVVPAHKRPFVQRPFERKLANMQIEEEVDMAKTKSVEKVKEAKEAPAPKKQVSRPTDWWFAAVC